MRARKKDRHLPACVYRKHGAYWLVKAGKWTRLGKELDDALAAYARIMETPKDSVAHWLDRLLEDIDGRVSPSTREHYKICAGQLRSIFAEFGIAQVEPRHVAQMMDQYRHQPSKANWLRSTLKSAFDLAIRAGGAQANPVTSIRRAKEEKRTRYITDREFLAIREQSNANMRCIIDLCFLTAQRIGDVLAIKLSDLTESGILVRQQKTGKPLLIQWSPALRKAVAEARALQPERKVVRLDGSGYLLGKRNGRMRGYHSIREQWRLACAKAGVQDARLHDLRAKSLTDADRQGLNAQNLAGHSSEAMTARYLRDRTPMVVAGPEFGRKC